MLRHCIDCTTAYAVDLQFCPHCGSTKWSPLVVGPIVIPLAPDLKPATPAPKPRKDKA